MSFSDAKVQPISGMSKMWDFVSVIGVCVSVIGVCFGAFRGVAKGASGDYRSIIG